MKITASLFTVFALIFLISTPAAAKEDPVSSVQFSPDESRILITWSKKPGGVFNIESGESLFALPEIANYAAFDPEATAIYLIAYDRFTAKQTLSIFEAESKSHVALFTDWGISLLQVSSNGEFLIFNSSSKGILNYDVQGRRVRAKIKLTQGRSANSLVLASNNNELFVADDTGGISVVNAASGVPLGSPRTLADDPLEIAKLPKNQPLFAAGEDKLYRLNAKTFAKLSYLKRRFGFRPPTIAVGGAFLAHCTVRAYLLNANTFAEIQTFRFPNLHGCSAVAVSQSGKLVAIAGTNGIVSVYDTTTLKRLQVFK